MKRVELVDHLCKKCGGRIARLLHHGPTGGGNPVWMCCDCEASIAGLGPDDLCWCGFRHKNNNIDGYMCLSFKILKKYPNMKRHFIACGSDPNRGTVGIMLKRDYIESIKSEADTNTEKE
jgi:hypothetical protein